MSIRKCFGIIGGDLRQYYLAKSLISDNHKVEIFGFDKIIEKTNDFKKLPLPQVILSSDYIVLPIPITRDNKNINAPFYESKIPIDDQLLNALKNKKVFGGVIISSIEKYVKNGDFLFFDYYRDDFIIPNAYLTAEGAIKAFLENSLKSINRSKCLVMGYGRIGKLLCRILKNFGANVTACARNIKDKALVDISGYRFINTNKIANDESLPSYDVIFNTIPAAVIDKNVLAKLSPESIIIDLASEPGGVDKTSAKKMNIKIFHELGIPGKYFPKSAGEITKKTIYQIITEENI